MEERDIIFKVGTKVKLRNYLKVGSYYGGVKFEDFCKQDVGKVLTITKVTPCNGYISTTKYGFEETPLEYTVEMLELLREKTMKYKVGDKVILNPKRVNKPGVFTIEEIISGDGIIFYKLSCDKVGGWLQEDIIKVPLFKIGQIVQFHNIKEDKWYSGTNEMANIEGKCGIITKVTENRYVADKQGQDGCTYEVKDLQDGVEWCVTSASLELVPMGKTSCITSVKQDEPELISDTVETESIIARPVTAEMLAQAVDNVKGPQFKIGDRVLIREDLVPGKKYEEWDYSPEDGMGGWEFAAAMAKYMGKVATITGYVADDPNYCRLDIDKGTYSWIINTLLPYTPGSDYDLDKTVININQQKQNKQNDSNQLQRKEEPLIGGCECTGTGVCYPGEQAATGIRHLGYRKVTYRC